jgi:deazaflavin-dependent oxidoreductase (nitroreductase family)
VDQAIRAALERDRTIDITTIGRRSGQPRRIETWSYYVDGRVYLSGSPGRRDWYANLLANPDFVFHLKRSVQADLPARARAVTDPAERRVIVTLIFGVLGRYGDVECWVARSPLVEVDFSAAWPPSESPLKCQVPTGPKAAEDLT